MPTEDILATSETTGLTKDDVAGYAILTLAAIGGVQVTRWTYDGAKFVTRKFQERVKSTDKQDAPVQ